MSTIEEKSPENLSRESIIRQALEAAARALEALAGNPTYQQAWRIAARRIRSMKLD